LRFFIVNPLSLQPQFSKYFVINIQYYIICFFEILKNRNDDDDGLLISGITFPDFILKITFQYLSIGYQHSKFLIGPLSIGVSNIYQLLFISYFSCCWGISFNQKVSDNPKDFSQKLTVRFFNIICFLITFCSIGIIFDIHNFNCSKSINKY